MKQRTILVVDDEASIRSALVGLLEAEDFCVSSAQDLTAARRLLASASFDAILLDLRLPDGSGLTLLEEGVLDVDACPVIVMSGAASIDVAVQAIQLGADDFLEKPAGADRVLLSLERALERTALRAENARLRAAQPGLGSLLGDSPVMTQLRAQVAQVADSEGRVLIRGENGSGKELIARALHEASRRAAGPFVCLNCGAIPSTLIESELFGHEKGAFTGAVRRKTGAFERAHQGTLFLDEMGDMPLDMQVRLLRVLQTGRFHRVGGEREIAVDVRVVAATHRDMEALVESGDFREDLYYRLNVVPIEAPPLRAHREDIPALVAAFADRLTAKNGRPPIKLSDAACAILSAHHYPGNVRELENLVERIVILAPRAAAEVSADFVRTIMDGLGRSPDAALYRPGVALSTLLADAERRIVTEALAAHEHRVADTARALSVDRSNFYKKLKSLGLQNR